MINSNLSDRLNSFDLSTRISAQEELASARVVSDWAEFSEKFSTNSIAVLRVVTDHLIEFLGVSNEIRFLELGKEFFRLDAPIFQDVDLFREALEAFLKNPRMTLDEKGTLLTKIISNELAKEKREKDVVLFCIRGITELRLKTVFEILETLIYSKEEKFVFETIRALRFIRDERSAVLLEKLFSNENREIVVAATEAYSAQGGTWGRYWRLYRMVSGESSEEVRGAVAEVFVQSPHGLGVRVLQRFYRVEQSEKLKLGLIKKIASIPTPMAARFLLNVASRESNPRLRGAAGWGFGNLPAERILTAIRSGLRSNNILKQKLSLLKVADLPLSVALRLLKWFIKNEKNLDQRIRLALIQTACRLPRDPKLDEFLMRQVGNEPLYRITAITGLMRKTNPALDLVREVMKRSRELGIQPVKAILSLLPEHPSLVSHPEFVEQAEFFLSHEMPEVAYLSSRVLARSGREEEFLKVWKSALNQNKEHWNVFASLLASAVSEGIASPLWIPEERDLDFFQLFLDHLATSTWSKQRWRELILSIFKPSSLGKAQIQIVQKFCLKHWAILGDIFDQILLEERDLDALKALTVLAGILPNRVRTDSLKAIFQSFTRGGYTGKEPVVLALLAVLRREELFPLYLNWLMSIDNGLLKMQGYVALGRWIDGVERSG